jgi:hypothetical protein
MTEWGTEPDPRRNGPAKGPINGPVADIPVGADPFDPYGLLDQALGERRSAVELCLYAFDRARSSGVAERIERGLAQLGVRAVRPDGLPFDPAQHEAAGVVPTEDPGLDGVVAETEVVGFTDHGRPLRAPVVLVYQRRSQP